MLARDRSVRSDGDRAGRLRCRRLDQSPPRKPATSDRRDCPYRQGAAADRRQALARRHTLETRGPRRRAATGKGRSRRRADRHGRLPERSAGGAGQAQPREGRGRAVRRCTQSRRSRLPGRGARIGHARRHRRRRCGLRACRPCVAGRSGRSDPDANTGRQRRATLAPRVRRDGAARCAGPRHRSPIDPGRHIGKPGIAGGTHRHIGSDAIRRGARHGRRKAGTPFALGRCGSASGRLRPPDTSASPRLGNGVTWGGDVSSALRGGPNTDGTTVRLFHGPSESKEIHF